MSDQADQLRRLMLREPDRATDAPALNSVIVAGGKGGVGTTSVACQLVRAVQQLGRNVALVDADLNRSDVFLRDCRYRPRCTPSACRG